MKYLSGIHALSIPSDPSKGGLNLPGNWETKNFTWNPLELRESTNSIFGDYGIEKELVLLPNGESYPVANYLRAILDLLSEATDSFFRLLRCFRIDFLCCNDYDQELFEKVVHLTTNSNWSIIDAIMESEYQREWLDFKACQ